MGESVKNLNQKEAYKFLLIFFACFLALFRSNNIGIDGYYFLAQWKYDSDLLEPHHLLHHWIYYFVGNWLISEEFIDHQDVFQILNIFFFMLALLELHKIRKLITGKSEYFTFLLVGFSGVGLRFATDVEVYIFPFFLSLAGTYKIFQFFQNQNKRDLIVGSLLINFAILNHQIQFMWWLVLTYFLYKKYSQNIQIIGIHLVFSLLVPMIYGLVAMQKGLGFWEFCLHDYRNGSAHLKFSWKSIFLTLINIPRTFLFFNEAFFHFNQHFFINIVSFIIGFNFLITNILLVKKLKDQFQFHEFQKMIFFLLIAYLLFALISHGNYEFMVGVPFFVVLLLPDLSKISVKLKIVLLSSLFLWNFIFLLIPFRFSDFYGKNDWLKIYQENLRTYFLLKEGYWFRNFIYFHTGIEKPDNIITQYDPKKIKNLLLKNNVILTDYPNTEKWNRRNFIQETVSIEQDFVLLRKYSYSTFYGEKFLYELRLKEN